MAHDVCPTSGQTTPVISCGIYLRVGFTHLKCTVSIIYSGGSRNLERGSSGIHFAWKPRLLLISQYIWCGAFSTHTLNGFSSPRLAVAWHHGDRAGAVCSPCPGLAHAHELARNYPCLSSRISILPNCMILQVMLMSKQKGISMETSLDPTLIYHIYAKVIICDIKWHLSTQLYTSVLAGFLHFLYDTCMSLCILQNCSFTCLHTFLLASGKLHILQC